MDEVTEWTIPALKEHFEKILEEKDKAIKAAQVSAQEAIDKAEGRLQNTLSGFPQEYARRRDVEGVQKEINGIKTDHVQRREFDGLKTILEQGRGARLALTGTLGIIIALIAVALGAMYANQLTSKDVSNQIVREAPWLIDRPGVDERISELEKEITVLKTQETLDKYLDKKNK